MRKKLSKAQKARNGRKRKQPELYFVIGGDINRTKCATAADATAHAKDLLRKRAEANGLVVGIDPASKDGDHTSLVELMKGPQWHINRIHSMPPYIKMTPKIERNQCVKGIKPLYVVKVMAVVEMKAAPMVVRKPEPDELPE